MSNALWAVRPQVEFEPFSSSHWDDPYPVYRALREQSPVHWAPKAKLFCLSRHADVDFVLRRPEQFSSRAMTAVMFENKRPALADVPSMLRLVLRGRVDVEKFFQGPPDAIINSDPPRHGELRGMVSRCFTPRAIAAWEPRIRQLVTEYLAPLRAGQPFDLVSGLSVPLPVVIVTEMLGVEPEWREDFKRWAAGFITYATGAGRESRSLREFFAILTEFRSYMRTLVEKRRREPREDLVSVLVDPAHAERLDEEELFSFIHTLLLGGNETTTNLIGNAAAALLDHPEQLALVLGAPERIPGLVEEALRWESPVQFTLRSAVEDVEVGGVCLPAGSSIALMLGAANRDERVFKEPDRFDVTRTPSPHRAFGFGIHHCLGAGLARLEARVALEELVPLLPGVRRADTRREYVDSLMMRGLTRLPLVPR
ncbi:cytochrome P450 [Myxococcus sp. Y35]|uniref:cytochrome P450 n=1 Tax=Pseudomyxococcus flavus TaxID=3115648 RepID=UPI003CF16EED